VTNNFWRLIVSGESEDRDCDEVMCARWGEPGGEWTRWGWWNEEGSWFDIYILNGWTYTTLVIIYTNRLLASSGFPDHSTQEPLYQKKTRQVIELKAGQLSGAKPVKIREGKLYRVVQKSGTLLVFQFPTVLDAL